jgi:hypothetical protein
MHQVLAHLIPVISGWLRGECEPGRDLRHLATLIQLHRLNKLRASHRATRALDALDEWRENLLSHAATAPTHVETVLMLQRCIRTSFLPKTHLYT